MRTCRRGTPGFCNKSGIPPAAGFHPGDPLFAQWAVVGGPGLDGEADGAPDGILDELGAAVDDARDADDFTPHSRMTFAVSSEDLPVVTTSSLMMQRVPSAMTNPRRRDMTPLSRSTKMPGLPNWRASSYATRMPPMAGPTMRSKGTGRNCSAATARTRAARSGYCRRRAHWT